MRKRSRIDHREGLVRRASVIIVSFRESKSGVNSGRYKLPMLTCRSARILPVKGEGEVFAGRAVAGRDGARLDEAIPFEPREYGVDKPRAHFQADPSESPDDLVPVRLSIPDKREDQQR